MSRIDFGLTLFFRFKLWDVQQYVKASTRLQWNVFIWYFISYTRHCTKHKKNIVLLCSGGLISFWVLGWFWMYYLFILKITSPLLSNSFRTWCSGLQKIIWDFASQYIVSTDLSAMSLSLKLFIYWIHLYSVKPQQQLPQGTFYCKVKILQ